MDCVRIGDDHPATRENVFAHLRHRHLAMIYFTAKTSTKLLSTWHLLLSGEGTTQSGFLNPVMGTTRYRASRGQCNVDKQEVSGSRRFLQSPRGLTSFDFLFSLQPVV